MGMKLSDEALNQDCDAEPELRNVPGWDLREMSLPLYAGFNVSSSPCMVQYLSLFMKGSISLTLHEGTNVSHSP